jgi:hypothetical protein
MKELATLTKTQFREWPLEKREEYLKEHPNSKFQWHNILEKKRVKLPTEVPKLGTNWKDHLYYADPEHHRKHAKAHRIAHEYLTAQAKAARGEKKEKLLKEAAKRKKWADKHHKVYRALSDHYLK